MRAFTADELASMRIVQNAAMMDTCTLRKWAPTTDNYGTEIPAYTDTTGVACGLDVSGGQPWPPWLSHRGTHGGKGMLAQELTAETRLAEALGLLEEVSLLLMRVNGSHPDLIDLQLRVRDFVQLTDGARTWYQSEGSRAFGATYVYANLLGNEAGRAIYDGGVIIASGGELVARGERLGMSDWAVTTAVVDLDRQRTAQSRTA